METIRKSDLKLTTRRKDAVIIACWTAVMVLLIIRAHITLYTEVPRFRVYRPFFSWYGGPSLDVIGWLILIGTCILVSMTLSDIKPLVCGAIVSFSLTFIIAVTYVSLYIWFVLGANKMSFGPYDWEYIVLMAIITIVRMVPYLLFVCMLGLVAGLLIRNFRGSVG
jgi:hypothetical protein